MKKESSADTLLHALREPEQPPSVKQATFRRIMGWVEEQRIEYRILSMDEVEHRWRGWCEGLLTHTGNLHEEQHRIEQRLQLAILHAWAMKKIPGRVNVVSLERERAKAESFLRWRESAGDNVERLKLKAASLNNVTPEELYEQFRSSTKKDYSPMAKLPTSLKEALEKIIAAGGSTVQENLLSLGITDAIMTKLLTNKLVEQPSVGLFRVIEQAVTAPKASPPKAAPLTIVGEPAASKPPKEAKPPKPPKPAKVPKPPKPEKAAKNPSELCLCGCSEKVPSSSRFRPGHDARLHSLVLKTIKAQGDKKALGEIETDAKLFPKGEQGRLQRAYLESAPWMDPATRKGIAL